MQRSWTRLAVVAWALAGCTESGARREPAAPAEASDSGGDAPDGRFGARAGFRAGIVEGFYGPPYSPDERAALVQFLGTLGLDTYLYAPKLDPRHRAEWRVPYGADQEAHFHDLVAASADARVHVVFGLSPGLDYDPNAGDQSVLEEKLGRMNDLGFVDFCLLFDDLVKDSPGADPNVQADAVARTFTFLRGRDPRTTLCLVPNYYIGTADELAHDRTPLAASFASGSSAFYEAYRRLPPRSRSCGRASASSPTRSRPRRSPRSPATWAAPSSCGTISRTTICSRTSCS